MDLTPEQWAAFYAALTQVFEAIASALSQLKGIPPVVTAVAAPVIMVIVRLLREEYVQATLASALGSKAEWEKWPKWLRKAAVFAVSALVAGGGALATGAGWVPVIGASIVAGLLAILGHKGSQAWGTARAELEPEPVPQTLTQRLVAPAKPKHTTFAGAIADPNCDAFCRMDADQAELDALKKRLSERQ